MLEPTVDPPRMLRVGHSIIGAGIELDALPGRLDGAQWDMVELDVLRHGDRLVVAHDPSELGHPSLVDFEDALRALAALVGPSVRFDVDIKSTGYEAEVAAAISAAGIAERTLVSTMERTSLAVLRREAPSLRLGLSVPLARRNYLAHPLTRPGAYGMLAYLRRVLPGRVARALDGGEADAIMAHWGVVTERLVSVVAGRGAELFVWTVDDARRLKRLRTLGVTGVITNERDLFERT
ncbi:MAG TPA: glycerophosphodiester phosphodiesterase [Solirubrobacteraceae bacterium]